MDESVDLEASKILRDGGRIAVYDAKGDVNIVRKIQIKVRELAESMGRINDLMQIMPLECMRSDARVVDEKRIGDMINPFAMHADPKQVAETLATLIPREGESQFGLYAERMKIMQEVFGITDEEMEVRMEEVRLLQEKEEEEERRRIEGKYVLWHGTFIGIREVCLTDDIAVLKSHLKGLESHLKLVVMDDTYILRLPDGRELWQSGILEWLKEQK